MIDKDKIDRLVDLQYQIDEIKEKIRNDVYSIAKQINSNVELGSWNINSTEINIDWHEYWSYGGHEHEYLSFPTQCLYDEEYLRQYIDELNEEQKKYEEEVKNAARATKKREYERLKKEFENEH